jgi:hypothetical protein
VYCDRGIVGFSMSMEQLEPGDTLGQSTAPTASAPGTPAAVVPVASLAERPLGHDVAFGRAESKTSTILDDCVDRAGRPARALTP